MTTDFETIIFGQEKDTVLVSYGDKISSSIYRGVPIRTPANALNMTESSCHTSSSTVPVEFIAEGQRLPWDFIQNVLYGGKESFTDQANLSYN